MTSLRVRAPAKINWTLEVLGKRPDGYHEVRTILQTIDLSDTLTLESAEDISLTLTGGAGALTNEPLEKNLAYRAALRLQRALADRPRGARIRLEKHIPIAAGLGGGSSDAAAALHGLRKLWELDISDDDFAALAAELGSDAPFFLLGGTALASGRGELIEPLPDVSHQRLLVASPGTAAPIDKTARMYSSLQSAHYTDGTTTKVLAARIRRSEVIREEDLSNVFEAVLPEVDPKAGELFRRAADLGLGQPHLCGSGPAFFLLLTRDQPADELRRSLEKLGMRTVEAHALTAAAAVAVEDVR